MSRAPTVWVAVGTRPEAIKMAPVVRGLRAAGVRAVVVSTGQHDALTADALRDLDLAVDLALAPVPKGSSLAGILAHVAVRVADALSVGDAPPDGVLVHGDTTGALAAALAASNARVPIGHVEAGLRTGDPAAPFPEEQNRRVIDRLASLWLAPTERAGERLRGEGCDPARVHVTGNPVVDALWWMRDRVGGVPVEGFPELAATGRGRPLVVVTAHRREGLGAGLLRICEVARRLAADGARVVWPVHPNPAVDGPVRAALAGAAGVHLTGALSYPAFVRLLLEASLVLTDSGGVQEEAACLGRPTLVLRELTERPEVFATGVVRVVGTDPAIVSALARDWLARPPPEVAGAAPLGDGHAGERIGAVVARWLDAR